MRKQETAKAVRCFVLHTGQQRKGTSQTEPPSTSQPQGPPLVASHRLLALSWCSSPRKPGPLLPSPSGLCAPEMAPLHAPEAESGDTQGRRVHTTLLRSAGRPCAGCLGLPFTPAGCLDALPPLSHYRAQGAAGHQHGGWSVRTPTLLEHCYHHLIDEIPETR